MKELKLGSNDLGKLEILIHEKLEQTKAIDSQVIRPESTAEAPLLKDADEPCFEAVNEELTGEPLTKHIITEETWRVDRSLFAAGASFHSSYDLVRRYETEIIINERRIRVETVTDIYSGKSVRADLTGLGPERSKITWAGLSLLICLAIEAALPLDRLQKVLFSALAIFSTSSLCRYMQLAARKLVHVYLFLIEELAAKADILAGDDSYTRCLEMEADAAQGFPKKDVDRDPLVNLLAAKLGRNFAYKKDETKNKHGIFVTHVHGRSDQNDPRSTIYIFRTHFGHFGNLLSKMLAMRPKAAPKLTVQGDLSPSNLPEPLLMIRWIARMIGCQVGKDVTTLPPYRPGLAQFTHPVLHNVGSLNWSYRRVRFVAWARGNELRSYGIPSTESRFHEIASKAISSRYVLLRA